MFSGEYLCGRSVKLISINVLEYDRSNYFEHHLHQKFQDSAGLESDSNSRKNFQKKLRHFLFSFAPDHMENWRTESVFARSLIR